MRISLGLPSLLPTLCLLAFSSCGSSLIDAFPKLLGTAVPHASPSALLAWSSIDGGAATGLNHDTTMYGKLVRASSMNSRVYITWREQNPSGGTRDNIRVSMLAVGGTFTSIDGNGVTGLNYNTNNFAGAPDITNDGTNLYVSWHESIGGTNYVMVKKWNGTAWTFLVDGTVGLHSTSGSAALNSKLLVVGTTLYCGWTESGRIHIMQYSGAGTNWSFIDGGTVNGLNHAGTAAAGNVNFATDGISLYATWNEDNGGNSQARVANYSGTPGTFNYLDGNGVTGLNLNTSTSVTATGLAYYNGKMILAWSEGGVIHSKSYDGVAIWTQTDGVGINYSPAASASFTGQAQMVVVNGRLYLTWDEASASYGGSYQTRVASYDGTSWQNADGNLASGLNFAPANSVNYDTTIAAFNGGVVTIWTEPSVAAIYQVHAKFGQ